MSTTVELETDEVVYIVELLRRELCDLSERHADEHPEIMRVHEMIRQLTSSSEVANALAVIELQSRMSYMQYENEKLAEEVVVLRARLATAQGKLHAHCS